MTPLNPQADWIPFPGEPKPPTGLTVWVTVKRESDGSHDVTKAKFFSTDNTHIWIQEKNGTHFYNSDVVIAWKLREQTPAPYQPSAPNLDENRKP